MGNEDACYLKRLKPQVNDTDPVSAPTGWTSTLLGVFLVVIAGVPR